FRDHRMRLSLLLSLLCSLFPLAQTLSPLETCSLCQNSLHTVHSSFIGRSPSKRLMNNQLKRECRRHYTYRRRCLALVKQYCTYMYAELISPSFKPVKVCYVLNECVRYDSVVVDEQLAALNETLPSSPDEYIQMREQVVERVIKSLRKTTTLPPEDDQEVDDFLNAIDNSTSTQKSTELTSVIGES
ncbi:hypothetical protein PMAYCL1PPCAC_17712, partial [Pristionchus mayeri]